MLKVLRKVVLGILVFVLVSLRRLKRERIGVPVDRLAERG